MALIKCPDCGRNVSDSAKACVECGKPLKKAKSRTGEATLSVLLGIGACWLWVDTRMYFIFPMDSLIFGAVLLISGAMLFAKSR